MANTTETWKIQDIRVRKKFTTPDLHRKLFKLKRRMEDKSEGVVYQSEMIVDLLLTHPKLKSL
jgi:hypothetical protein